jgi:alpha-L-rhamnosidase
LVIPNILSFSKAFAIWGDVSALTPKYLFEAYGDARFLQDQWESMISWLEQGIKRDATGLWDPQVQQLGDWLDPTAPEDKPDETHSDSVLVANAFLIYTTQAVAKIASILGLESEASKYKEQAKGLIEAFQNEYMTPNGLVMSDTQATLALVLRFGLSNHPAKTAERLDWHIRRRAFTICTGFAGTPVILKALVDNGYLNTAYRMFQERQCPSLLYPIYQGATTIWERWNSMLPNGQVNPGEMTSFNHYALGQVSSFLYETVGGISALAQGWERVLIKPQPGGSVRWATVSHISPYGRVACSWRIKDQQLHISVIVPPNSVAQVVLPGIWEEIGSGERAWTVPWSDDPAWPPKVLQPAPMRPQLVDEAVL